MPNFGWGEIKQFYFIPFYYILFYPILFYSILFYSILFYSILFYSILFHSIPFYPILFYPILFHSILFYSILFYSLLFYSILFYSILFYSILFYSIGNWQGGEPVAVPGGWRAAAGRAARLWLRHVRQGCHQVSTYSVVEASLICLFVMFSNGFPVNNKIPITNFSSSTKIFRENKNFSGLDKMLHVSA